MKQITFFLILACLLLSSYQYCNSSSQGGQMNIPEDSSYIEIANIAGIRNFQKIYLAKLKFDAFGEIPSSTNPDRKLYLSVSDDIRSSIFLYYKKQRDKELKKLLVAGKKYYFKFSVNPTGIITGHLIEVKP